MLAKLNAWLPAAVSIAAIAAVLDHTDIGVCNFTSINAVSAVNGLDLHSYASLKNKLLHSQQASTGVKRLQANQDWCTTIYHTTYLEAQVHRPLASGAVRECVATTSVFRLEQSYVGAAPEQQLVINA